MLTSSKAALGPASVVSVWVRSYDLIPAQLVTETVQKNKVFSFLFSLGWLIGWVCCIGFGLFFRVSDVAGKTKGLRRFSSSSTL